MNHLIYYIKVLIMAINLKKSKFYLIMGFLIIVFGAVSCSFYSKDAYLEDFASFVTEVEQNYQSYSEEDWLNADQKYEEYVGETYNNFRAELTNDDKKQVGKLKTKFQTVKIKHEAGQIMDDVSDGINQLHGVIEGVIETINNQ